MAKLPHLPRLPHHPHLAAWLHEWNLAESLRAGEPADNEPREDDPAEFFARDYPAENEPAASVGQVRLLSRRVLPAGDRPVYVAVLADWGDGLLLAAPYSAFLSPASPGELLTARPEPALRVLCAWNARSVPADLLTAGSWLVDDLSLAETEEAWAVFRHAATAAALPAGLAARIGAPTVSADDPRVRYQYEEDALLAPLTEAALRHEEWSWLRAADRPDLALAADRAGSDAQMIEREYRVFAPTGEAGTIDAMARLRVKIFLLTPGRRLALAVTDEHGNPDPSLDGASVCDAYGRIHATINHSQARWDAESSHGGIFLQRESGKRISLSLEPTMP